MTYRREHVSALSGLGGCIDWTPYGLDQIWQLLRDENGRTSWTQHDAWHRTATLCDDQANHLERALRQLNRRWPARPGSAAHVFTIHVQSLIASMRQCVKAARANRQAIYNVTRTVAFAKARVAKLVDQAQQYTAAEPYAIRAGWYSAENWYRGRDSTTPLPAARPLPPEDWRTQLDQQARQIMAEADAIIAVETDRMQPPEPYSFGIRDDSGNPLGAPAPSANGGFEGSGFASGIKPPAYDLPSNIADRPGNAALPTLIEPIYDGDREPILDGLPITGPGPISDGRGHGPFPPLPAVGSGVTPEQNVSVIAPTMVNAAQRAPGRASPAPRTSAAAAAKDVPTRRGRGFGVSTGQPMAPMIPPTGGPPGRASSGVGQAGRPAGPGQRRRPNDPDDPWYVKQGGPAVLEPPPDIQDHDPGPGVIGLTR